MLSLILESYSATSKNEKSFEKLKEKIKGLNAPIQNKKVDSLPDFPRIAVHTDTETRLTLT